MRSAVQKFYHATVVLLLTCWSFPSALMPQENVAPNSTQEVTITGKELWSKTIAYHNPQGKWATFSGKVHLVTTFSDGTYSEEELEVRKPDDFYQSTRFAGKVRAVKGVRNGTCFNAVDDNNKSLARRKSRNTTSIVRMCCNS